MEAAKLIQLVAFVKPPIRPPLPQCIYPQIIELMQQCWCEDPNSRPDFVYILDVLKRLV